MKKAFVWVLVLLLIFTIVPLSAAPVYGGENDSSPAISAEVKDNVS